ncbi:MAG: hypothetical protein ACOH2N_00530 [Devosia sp.]
MTGRPPNRIGTLHRIAEIARAAHPTSLSQTEIVEAIIAPPAIGAILAEVLADAEVRVSRPMRVPNTGRRP